MLLVLEDSHKEHLSFLSKVNIEDLMSTEPQATPEQNNPWTKDQFNIPSACLLTTFTETLDYKWSKNFAELAWSLFRKVLTKKSTKEQLRFVVAQNCHNLEVLLFTKNNIYTLSSNVVEIENLFTTRMLNIGDGKEISKGLNAFELAGVKMKRNMFRLGSCIVQKKLDVSMETVQHGVEGMMYLLTESSKLMLNEIDFQDSIISLGFPEILQSTLLHLYLENCTEIRTVLSHMSADLPHYHSLEWRFEVQLANRSLRHQVTPQMLMKLHLKDSSQAKTHLLQTDPVNLLHLTQVLDTALQEIKSPYCRRIVRNIK